MSKRERKWTFWGLILAAITVGVIVYGLPVVAQYNVPNYIEQGGARTVIGGSLDVVSGGDLDIESGASLKMAGTAISSTAAELNALDGLTSTVAELNILDTVTSTAAELNILDGVTSTTAELNILDTVTSTAAELNILDGVTATEAEIDILDGVTATTAEINVLDDGIQGEMIFFCGESCNNSTCAGGHSVAFLSGDYSASHALAAAACDTLGETSIAAASEAMSANNAFKVSGMYCVTDSSGSNGVILALTAADAATTPAVTCTIATGETTCASTTGTTTDIAAAAVVAVSIVTTEDLSGNDFSCRVFGTWQ